MNNDLISREALKKVILNSPRCDFENDIFDFDIDSIFEYIDNAPAVDTTCPHCDSGYAQGYSDGYLRGKEERPQGEWKTGYTAKQKKVAVCNLCNCISFQGKTNFCHNCGAKMQKGGAE